MANYNAKPPKEKAAPNSFQGVGNSINSLTDNKHKPSIYDEVKPQNISIDNNDDVISMQIVLLNGKKQTVKMNANNHTINDLYGLVKSIHNPGRFELLQGFPPKSLNDGSISVGSAGLKQQRIIQKKLKNIPNNTPNNNKASCPICNKLFHPNIINAHLDQCISSQPQKSKPQKKEEEKNENNLDLPDEIKKFTQLVKELDIKQAQQNINVIDYKKKEYDGIIPYIGFLVGLSMMGISLNVNDEIFSISKEDPFKYFINHWNEYNDNKKKSIHGAICGQLMTEKEFNENGEKNDNNSDVNLDEKEFKDLMKKYKKLNNLEKKVYLLKFFMFIGTDLNRLSDDKIDVNTMNEEEIKNQNAMLNGGFASMIGGMINVIASNNINMNNNTNNNKVPCPICNELYHPDIINAHLDQCIAPNINSNQSIKPSISQTNVLDDDDDDDDDIKLDDIQLNDNDLYYGFKPKTTESYKGYYGLKKVSTSGYCLGPGGLKPERSDILFITLNIGKKSFCNVFTNKEVGIDENIELYSKSVLHKSISNRTIKLYYHDTDPNNKPILGDFDGKYKLYFYPMTKRRIKIRKAKHEKREEIRKDKEEKEHKEWNESYCGTEWKCFNCSTNNTTRTCSNCYFAENEKNREPKQRVIDNYNKLILKFKEIQNIKNINEKSFCFNEYYQDTQNKAICINQENKQLIINRCQNKISHIVGKLGFNKGRHSLKVRYRSMNKYPQTFFGIIFRITLTNKCCADKPGDLFGFRGKVYHNWEYNGKKKTMEYSSGENGMGFGGMKIWNSNKEIQKNNNKDSEYNICEVVVDFDEQWCFCFLNDKLTIYRWGKDTYGYELMSFKAKDEHGLYYWCFECCAGDWTEPFQILHCY